MSRRISPDQHLKLLDQSEQVLRFYHYSCRTGQAYCNWIVTFLKFHQLKKHPRDMGKKEIDAYLSHLAVKENVAISTQRQAMNAILFLYHHVPDIPISDESEPFRAENDSVFAEIFSINTSYLIHSEIKAKLTIQF